jgi:hypothetical protein
MTILARSMPIPMEKGRDVMYLCMYLSSMYLLTTALAVLLFVVFAVLLRSKIN